MRNITVAKFNNIYFVICIELTPSYLRLWHLILSPSAHLVDILLYQHRDVLLIYSYMICMHKPFLAIIVLVVIPILPIRVSLSGLTLWAKLPVAVDPWANTGLSPRSTTTILPLKRLVSSVVDCLPKDWEVCGWTLYHSTLLRRWALRLQLAAAAHISIMLLRLVKDEIDIDCCCHGWQGSSVVDCLPKD